VSNGPTTRYLCPLNCGWHHDETDPDFSNPSAVHPFVEQDWASGIDGLVAGLAAGRAAVVEAAVKAHLETHPLIEWAQALAEARQERDELQARVDAVDWPALHKVVSAEQERRQRYDRHNAGRCPMCGQEGTGGWICEADMTAVVRPMRGPQRRAWRRFERPKGEPVQGSGYTTAELLGAPLRTPATPSRTMPDKAATSSDAADKAGEP
jgi:hypothetical protein